MPETLRCSKATKNSAFGVTKASNLWAQAGKLVLIQDIDGQNIDKADLNRFANGGVRITEGTKGTEVKWESQSPCIASLYVAISWLKKAAAPFVLRFHASGWFEEFYDDAQSTCKRIEAIITHSDRHFPVRTFVEEVEPSRRMVADLLVDILENQKDSESYSVECEYNKFNDRFTVDRIGSKSPIARFYGTYTNSFPCTVSSYGDQVSAGYRAVLSNGRPRVDHVLAAFRLPDNQVHWVPYHRLILPVVGLHKIDRVHVVSQIAPVAFKVI